MNAQQEFDRKYITSTEVCTSLGIERSTLLLAIRGGRFPEGITVNRPNGATLMRLWERESVTSLIRDWHTTLARGATA